MPGHNHKLRKEARAKGATKKKARQVGRVMVPPPASLQPKRGRRKK